MGNYVNNGKVTLGSQYNYNVAASEIANLIGVGRRDDGKLYLADICMGRYINIWAKNKPFRASQPFFDTNAERDEARARDMYGITVSSAPHERNNNVHISQWGKVDLAENWKRIRDFDGYNHNAKGGIEILNKSSYSNFISSTNVLLKTETPTNDGVSMEDILQYFILPIKSYQWVLIDSYGFIYGLRSFASYDDLLANLNSGMSLLVCDNFLTSLTDWRKNPSKATPFIPAMNGGQLTVGLAAVFDSIPTVNNPYTKNQRLLLNSLDLAETRTNLMGLNTTFGIEGYGANMLIGSIYEGKSPLHSKMYGGNVLECCVDDCIFMGFRIYQNLQDAIDYLLTYYLEVDIYVNGFPYWSRVPFYNGGNSYSTFTLAKGQRCGSRGENEGNAWSEGCFFFAPQQLFKLFPNQTDFDIQLTVANYMQDFQGLPFARFTIRNTGKYVSEVEAKANYPTNRNIAWYKYQ